METNKSKYLFWSGIALSIFYVFTIGYSVLPLVDLSHFINNADYNERGDFLAGIFGPLVFMWLVIGYFIQASELNLQRNTLISQNKLLLHQIEIEKRKQDPIFELTEFEEADESGELKKRIVIENVSDYTARQVIIHHLDHINKKQLVVGIATGLPKGRRVNFDPNPDLHYPEDDKEAEFLVIYNSQLEDIRMARFTITETNGPRVGWQIEESCQYKTFYK